MLPELGHLLLIFAFLFSICQTSIGLWAFFKKDNILMYWVPAWVYAEVSFLFLSYFFLTYAFFINDFSLAYVAGHSHSLLPWPYRISAVWGAHEGSIFLWIVLLAGWMGAFCFFSKKHIPLKERVLILSVLGFLCIGFLSFLIFTSNPFFRLLPVFPSEGYGLNPLLQDPGLAIHPPMLYMGYVGFAVTFALAIAALVEGSFDQHWVAWMKPWVLFAWSCLTCGITLGSWWAYRVLGWGGWWFWDPVENASLLPWLTATALLHSLRMVEKRNTFKVWTLLLAILTFSLSLLGTFLVRSGVLISVHAFANDPLRGSFLLKFLMSVVCLSLLLFAIRSSRLCSQQFFKFFSKETFLLINNIIFFVLMLSILFGTLYPLFLEVLNLGKVSVGPPYFNFIVTPFLILLLAAMSLGPLCYWKSTPPNKVLKLLVVPAIVSFFVMFVFVFIFPHLGFLKIVQLFFSSLLIFSTIKVSFQKNASRFGMSLAHGGVGVCALGIIFASFMNLQAEVSVAPGEIISLGDYQFYFLKVRGIEGKNYEGVAADFVVHKKNKIFYLSPERRRYISSSMPVSQAAITTNMYRDLYLVLGEPLGKKNWAVRVYNKAGVRFIWLGGFLMMLGGLMAWRDSVKRKGRGQ
ncbi:MAG: hypothetical protein A3G71_03045 [Gammaproteobacteria bacterium RIFCSPLOWO2_12_FULL_38_14]|nr:MAG: hypothetical protein A3B69_00440 [Gammaproteobacteria bacterium RIFCSPHIGHO2_02_FULL_38_33]OGT24841.1 MAG: hypothetical protein A2W47_07535 [Gammaproteobacteria bacterium RIFCSPHIGHO2_12_38_15]OGT75406.1 MAG: hypothetical protein A3G71_03045 [Gammaproteobacteria bacterium RIFCSPLOWO2_12_FULL_38_14]